MYVCYCLCCTNSHELISVDGDDIPPVIDRSYRVLTTHPKRYYGAADSSSTLLSLSLPKQCLLTVEQSEDENTNTLDDSTSSSTSSSSAATSST
jgi:hypothetical protein